MIRPNEVQEALQSLHIDGRVMSMVSLRYGLDGHGERSLRQIARVHGLSYERTRVLVNKAVWGMARHGFSMDSQRGLLRKVAA